MPSDWFDTIYCEDCRYVGFEIEPAYVSVAQRRIDAARLRSRPPQTDLSSFNASADAIQTSSINTRENLS